METQNLQHDKMTKKPDIIEQIPTENGLSVLHAIIHSNENNIFKYGQFKNKKCSRVKKEKRKSSKQNCNNILIT